jgi:Zn-dependent protease with chaperone function
VTLLNILIETVDIVIGPITPLRALLLRWQRSAEYSCDRAALLVSQDYKVVASVLMKLCGGSSKNVYSKDLNVDAFLEQAKQLDIEKNTIGGRVISLANDQMATHPIPVVRVQELIEWSNSAQFSGLMGRSRRVKVVF